MSPREAVARKLCEHAQDDWRSGQAHWLTVADDVLSVAALTGGVTQADVGVTEAMIRRAQEYWLSPDTDHLDDEELFGGLFLAMLRASQASGEEGRP